MSDHVDSNEYLCVTCGELKPGKKFHEGDCTCVDCYDDGNGGVNYPDDRAKDECQTCGTELGDHAIVRIDGTVSYICPTSGDSPTNQDK